MRQCVLKAEEKLRTAASQDAVVKIATLHFTLWFIVTAVSPANIRIEGNRTQQPRHVEPLRGCGGPHAGSELFSAPETARCESWRTREFHPSQRKPQECFLFRNADACHRCLKIFVPFRPLPSKKRSTTKEQGSAKDAKTGIAGNRTYSPNPCMKTICRTCALRVSHSCVFVNNANLWR